MALPVFGPDDEFMSWFDQNPSVYDQNANAIDQNLKAIDQNPIEQTQIDQTAIDENPKVIDQKIEMPPFDSLSEAMQWDELSIEEKISVLEERRLAKIRLEKEENKVADRRWKDVQAYEQARWEMITINRGLNRGLN